MRRVVLLAALAALGVPAPAFGADVVTFSAQPRVVAYDGLVRLHGSTVPLSEVFLVQRLQTGWTVIAQTRAGTDGAFVFERRARTPGVYQARTLGGQSAEAATTIRPRLRARLRGSILTGRVLPARAGAVVLRAQGRTRRLRVGSAGRFRARLGHLRAGRHLVQVSVRPAAGYVRAARRFAFRIRRPALRLGSHGPGVLVLKRRLAELGYALPSVDSGYGWATYEAVLAFQKVHGLPRTGGVDRRFWQVLGRASRPRPSVGRGDYLEVRKTQQTLYEVRDGKVARVIHVSTGVTGNTPVGTWR
ncbi:MAG TPA: L,D-transpeptidase family protein, partial [Gaiellaceae bacterium]|nr:L,D-transpeptidase family protein [Gaiellaceae bacterium]